MYIASSHHPGYLGLTRGRRQARTRGGQSTVQGRWLLLLSPLGLLIYGRRHGSLPTSARRRSEIPSAWRVGRGWRAGCPCLTVWSRQKSSASCESPALPLHSCVAYPCMCCAFHDRVHDMKCSGVKYAMPAIRLVYRFPCWCPVIRSSCQTESLGIRACRTIISHAIEPFLGMMPRPRYLVSADYGPLHADALSICVCDLDTLADIRRTYRAKWPLQRLKLDVCAHAGLIYYS